MTSQFGIEKTLVNTDKTRLVWAFFRSVLDRDWGKILSRDPKINKKLFPNDADLISGEKSIYY